MSDPAAAAADAAAIVPAGDREAWSPRFGDMVWAKVKSHPWWPGHVYSVTLTDDQEVHRGHRDGLVLVAFFGDGSYGWFEPHELVRFEDHFAEKASQGGSRSFSAAVAESVDEIARRGGLAVLCPCRRPHAFRPHNDDPRFLLIDVPGFDRDAEYHADQVTAARERFVPRMVLDFLQTAAVEQRNMAEKSAKTLPGIETAAMLMAYRRSTFALHDCTYAEAFGLDPAKALAAEEKAEAERPVRARPIRGRQRMPENHPGSRRGAGGAAARLMEKVVPGAPAIRAKVSKKDQYLLKRREDARAPPPPASMPEPSHRMAALPDVYPTGAAPALDDGPPGFPTEPQTPPLPSSGGGEEEFMLQRRAIPPGGQVSEGGAATDAGPNKATKPKKARKREREEPQPADGAPTATAAATDGEPKKKKKKKKLADLNGSAPSAAPSGGGGAKPAAFAPPVADLDGLDLKQVISNLQNLPLLPFYGAGRRISDASQSFVLAFRSKHYIKSYENDPPEESTKSLDTKANVAAAAADGQPRKPAKKKSVMRPSDPAIAGVKRGPSDRQEELAAKKKTKLDKIKTLATEKKDAAAVAAVASVTPAAQQQPRAGTKEKPVMAAKKKMPAAAAIKTPSPTALMMKFPLKSTLPSVASLKARFARFGPLDVDGIRVYWKSHMCRVIYRFQSDAEVALKYARGNAMFGQVVPHYYLREVESASASAGGEPDAAAPTQQRTDLRLMETAPFRPGSSGIGAPLTLSRAAPARTAVGQPKSILKKSSDDGAAGAAGALKDSPRVKFVLDGGDNKLDPPALPASGGGNGLEAAAPTSKSARSVGFAPPPLQPPARPTQSQLQPPMRPAQQQPLQPPRAPATQTLPPPPPLQQHHLAYQPRVNDGQLSQALPGQPSPYGPLHADVPVSFSGQPPYQPRHSDAPPALPGQPPLPPYPPRSGFPGQFPPRSNDTPAAYSRIEQGHGGDDMPVWKRGGKEFNEELMRVMLRIAKLVDPLMDKNGNFPYHLFRPA